MCFATGHGFRAADVFPQIGTGTVRKALCSSASTSTSALFALWTPSLHLTTPSAAPGLVRLLTAMIGMLEGGVSECTQSFMCGADFITPVKTKFSAARRCRRLPRSFNFIRLRSHSGGWRVTARSVLDLLHLQVQTQAVARRSCTPRISEGTNSRRILIGCQHLLTCPTCSIFLQSSIERGMDPLVVLLSCSLAGGTCATILTPS